MCSFIQLLKHLFQFYVTCTNLYLSGHVTIFGCFGFDHYLVVHYVQKVLLFSVLFYEFIIVSKVLPY